MKLQQTLGFFLLFTILCEFVETRNLFKFERPCKYYRPRPHSHRLRSSIFRRPPIYGHLKKAPLKHPHYYRRRPPSDTWHQPHVVENQVEKEPYTIEIEFPKRYKSSQRLHDLHNRNYGLRAEEDYHSDDEDDLEVFEDEIMRLVKKGLRIKAVKSTNPKLRIKVSRDDSDESTVNPLKFIAAASHLQHNAPIGFFKNFDRESAQNGRPVYFVTEFPEFASGG